MPKCYDLKRRSKIARRRTQVSLSGIIGCCEALPAAKTQCAKDASASVAARTDASVTFECEPRYLDTDHEAETRFLGS